MKEKINKSVLMVGTARDVGSTFAKNFKILEQALSIFISVDYFIVESDSADSTIFVLEELSSQKSNFEYLSMGKLVNEFPDRVKRIAYCRNEYVRKIRESRRYDYVVVADLDGINKRISRKSIQSCFEREKTWEVVTASQPFGYYDLFALRAEDWNVSNCFRIWNERKEVLLLGEKKIPKIAPDIRDFFKYDRHRKDIIYSKMKCIYPFGEWIPVISAFGGFAIYKSWIFQKYDYSASDESQERENCEHVYLNLKIKEGGYRIFINPRLVNSWINEYNLNKLKIIRFYRYYLKPRFSGRS